MIRNERLRIISVLGVVEILAWGSSYYLLAVLAAPIARDTGWSSASIMGGVSLGLLVSGVSARKVGRLIQAEGGRRVMAVGMLLLACGLALLGFATTLPLYFAAWCLVGMGMSAGLYDAAFSSLGHLYRTEARSAITALTLWGGFASTVCWPISALLVESYGWRATCLIYAGVHVLVTAPMCWFAVPGAQPVPVKAVPSAPRQDGARNTFRLRFWCIAVAGTLLAMIATVWSVHLITILTAKGYALAAAVGLGTLIGPAQVGARVLEMLGKGRHHPVWTMIASTAFVLFGFAGLLTGIPAAVALLAYGAGNGLWSIARGALPLAAFGAEDYPYMMGRLAMPMLIAAAVAPLIGSVLMDRFGTQGTLLALTLASIIPCLAAAILWLDLAKDWQRASFE
ncbi:MFS transporter [Labrenzia sp. 011]|uniref:MFS transporter n=1 Tax=Labrenzia sp. 011 TaxID=2171494 RepID=UPI00197B8649|nr:MFS transporter [Labrenzia sp. 011]